MKTKQIIDGLNDILSSDTNCDTLRSDAMHITNAIAELERLAKVEAALPKTADGVPVVPGMTLYLMPCRSGATEVDMMTLTVDSLTGGDYCWYSSAAAALSAAAAGGGGGNE